MIGVEPEPPSTGGPPPAPWFYPVVPGRPAEPLGRFEHLRVAAKVRARLWWTRLSFRLWRFRPVALSLVAARFRLRLIWMALLRDVRGRMG